MGASPWGPRNFGSCGSSPGAAGAAAAARGGPASAAKEKRKGFDKGLTSSSRKVEGSGPGNPHDYEHYLRPAVPDEQAPAETHLPPLGVVVSPDIA